MTPPTPQSGEDLDDKTPQKMSFVSDRSTDFTYQSSDALLVYRIADIVALPRDDIIDSEMKAIVGLIRSAREKAQLEARINELGQLHEAAYKVAVQRGTDLRELAQAYDDQINNRLKELRKGLK